MATKTNTPAPLNQAEFFDIVQDGDTQYISLTDKGIDVAVKLANIYAKSMNPSWVMMNDKVAFGKVINYASHNTGQRLKDIFNMPTIGDRTLATAIASYTVEMLSLPPVAPANDPLVGLI